MKMKLPEGACSFSIGGVELDINAGHVNVPDHFAVVAKEHGLTIALLEVVEQQPVQYRKGNRVAFLFEGVPTEGNIKSIKGSIVSVLDDDATSYEVDVALLSLVE